MADQLSIYAPELKDTCERELINAQTFQPLGAKVVRSFEMYESLRNENLVTQVITLSDHLNPARDMIEFIRFNLPPSNPDYRLNIAHRDSPIHTTQVCTHFARDVCFLEVRDDGELHTTQNYTGWVSLNARLALYHVLCHHYMTYQFLLAGRNDLTVFHRAIKTSFRDTWNQHIREGLCPQKEHERSFLVSFQKLMSLATQVDLLDQLHTSLHAYDHGSVRTWGITVDNYPRVFDFLGLYHNSGGRETFDQAINNRLGEMQTFMRQRRSLGLGNRGVKHPVVYLLSILTDLVAVQRIEGDLVDNDSLRDIGEIFFSNNPDVDTLKKISHIVNMIEKYGGSQARELAIIMFETHIRENFPDGL
jgi:hypothetical protein